MIVLCPHCHKAHSLPEGGLPAPRAATRCKGCGQRFILNQGEDGVQASPEQPAAIGGDLAPGGGADRPATTELNSAGDDLASGGDQPGAWAGPSPVLDGETGDAEEDSPAEKILRTFPQLRILARDRFSLEKLFSPTRSGEYRTRLNRFKAGLLLATSSLLNDKVLLPGEKVGKIARGSAFFLFEIPYLNGLLTLPSNYYALVCTTHRLLMINLDFRRSRPAGYIFQIYFDEISVISRGHVDGSLAIKTRTGRKWRFTTVKKTLARDLADWIKSRLNQGPSEYYDGVPRRQLCPVCLIPLADGLDSCPVCRADFKSAGEAMKRSLLLPGMGEIYLGNYFPGFSMLTGYLLTWLVAVVLIIVDLAGGLRGAGLLILSYHLFAGLLARRLAHKGYLAEPRNELPPD